MLLLVPSQEGALQPFTGWACHFPSDAWENISFLETISQHSQGCMELSQGWHWELWEHHASFSFCASSPFSAQLGPEGLQIG